METKLSFATRGDGTSFALTRFEHADLPTDEALAVRAFLTNADDAAADGQLMSAVVGLGRLRDQHLTDVSLLWRLAGALFFNAGVSFDNVVGPNVSARASRFGDAALFVLWLTSLGLTSLLFSTSSTSSVSVLPFLVGGLFSSVCVISLRNAALAFSARAIRPTEFGWSLFFGVPALDAGQRNFSFLPAARRRSTALTVLLFESLMTISLFLLLRTFAEPRQNDGAAAMWGAALSSFMIAWIDAAPIFPTLGREIVRTVLPAAHHGDPFRFVARRALEKSAKTSALSVGDVVQTSVMVLFAAWIVLCGTFIIEVESRLLLSILDGLFSRSFFPILAGVMVVVGLLFVSVAWTILSGAFFVSVTRALGFRVRDEIRPRKVRGKGARDVAETLLKRHALFASLDENARSLLLASSSFERYLPGQLVVQQHDDGNHFYMCLGGELLVERLSESGTVTRLGLLVAGDGFGERALVEKIPRTATVRARTSAECLAIARNVFVDVIGELGAQNVLARVEASRHLRRSAIFAGLPDETIEHVAQHVQRRSTTDGEAVVSEGSDATAFYLVQSGSFSVERGPEKKRIAILDVGQPFGEQGVLRKSKRNATVRSIGEGTVLEIGADVFLAALRSNTAFAAAIGSVVDARRASAVLS